MTDDDLRTALAAADPVRSADLDPLTSPRARELLERAMTTPLTTPDRAATGPSTLSPTRRPWLAAAAAAVVLAGGGAAYLATTDDGGASPGGSSGEQLVLALPEGDPLTASCLVPSAESLRGVPVAFAGTATAVTDDEVRLEVDRWYAGGDAGTVLLRTQPEVMQVLLGATDFAQGEDYLVSADQGTVTACGLTGPASPELQGLYDEAFPG